MDSCLCVKNVCLLFTLICFPCINGFLFLFTDLPIMEPASDKEVAVNDSIHLSCRTSKPQELFISLNDTTVKRENTTSISYNLMSNKLETYMFKCNLLSGTVKITFRYYPQITSIKILIMANENIESGKLLHVKLNFTIKYINKLDYIKITRKVPKTNLIEESNITFNNLMYEFDSNINIEHVFKIKLGENESDWTFFPNLTYYKLHKLQGSISVKDSESLSLSYKIENMYEKILAKNQCLYRIFYKSEWEPNPKNFTMNKTDIVLENLVPYTKYTIDIQAKRFKSIYWSDKWTKEIKTLSSAAYSGPHATNGSYFETPCKKESKRCFIFYWAMIPMALRNGILDDYVIQQDSKILLETPEIFGEIKDQAKNKDLWFEIRAKNKNSLLSPPTVIHIPPKAPERPIGISVVQLNNTYFNISWTLKQPLRNVTVTVMSCLGKIVISTLSCKSNVKFTSIKDRSFLILKAGNTSNFAVYVSNSIGSSSLTLAECILTRGIARIPKTPIIQQKDSFKVKLILPKFDCKDLNGRPTLFQILYAEGNNCENGLQRNISAIGLQPETESVEIKDLKQFTNYSLCLRVLTEDGWSKMSPQIITKTLLGTENKNFAITIALPIIVIVFLGLLLYCCIKKIKKCHEKTNINFEIPLIYENDKVDNSNHFYTYIGPDSQTQLNDSQRGKQENPALEVDDDKSTDSSTELMEITNLNQKELSSNQENLLKSKCPQVHFTSNKRNDINPSTELKLSKADSSSDHGNNCRDILSKLTTDHLDDNGYIFEESNKVDSDLSQLNQDHLNSKDDSHNEMNSFELSQANFDSNGYLQDIKNKSNLSQTNLDSNGHDIVESPELSQANFDSNGYVQNAMNSSESSPANSDSNGYIQKAMNSSESSQANSDSNGYVQKAMNSSESSQANSDSNGYVQAMNSSESSQANSDSNEYVQKAMNSSESGQANSDSNGYVQNAMNSSESSQTNSDSNGYVQNITNSSELSPANSNSNGYVQNAMNSSESSLANSDSNGYVQNVMNSSESSQTNSDSNGYVQNITNSSELSSANSDSNGYVQNAMNSSESSLANSDSNGYVQNITNSSELSSANSDSNGYVQNAMNSSESSLANSDSNGYVQNVMNSSESSQTNSDSNGYVQNITNSSELSPANSDSNGKVKNIMNSSELSKANSDSDGYIMNIMNTSKFSKPFTDMKKKENISEC